MRTWAAARIGAAAIAAAAPKPEPPRATEAGMTMHAKGTFEVELKLAPAGEPEGMERRTIARRWHGDLEAESRGEMLSAGDPARGSAGLVAMEMVTGGLRGKRGSFALQQRATMQPGAMRLGSAGGPGSGTGELAGLGGEMTIVIEGTRHSYDLAYTLAGP